MRRDVGSIEIPWPSSSPRLQVPRPICVGSVPIGSGIDTSLFSATYYHDTPWLARSLPIKRRSVGHKASLLCLPFLSRQGEDRLTGGSACVGIIEVTEARQGAVATFFNHVNSSPVYRIPLTKAGRARFLENFSTSQREGALRLRLPLPLRDHRFLSCKFGLFPREGISLRLNIVASYRKRGTNGLCNDYKRRT